MLYHCLYILLHTVLLQYCTLFYCQCHTVTLSNEFDGIWTSCGLRRRGTVMATSVFMIKMVWSQAVFTLSQFVSANQRFVGTRANNFWQNGNHSLRKFDKFAKYDLR